MATSVFGQFQKMDSLEVDNITHLSIDSEGHLFVGDLFGNVKEYNQSFSLLNEFSPINKSAIGVLAPWNPLRVMVFFTERQEFTFLDRFLVSDQPFQLKETFARVATPSFDNNIWFVNENNFTLNKYNIRFNQTEVTTSLDLILDTKNYEITHLREYQNLLFLCDKSAGLLVFDNLGNYLETVNIDGLDYFSFRQNELVFIKNNALHLMDIYAQSKYEFDLPMNNIDQMVCWENFCYGLSNKTIYKFALDDKHKSE